MTNFTGEENEIKKMYENANAYKMLCNCEFKNLFDYSIDYGQDVCIHAEDEIRKGCEGCELAEQNVKYYPPFTAEKQIELIKWLIKTNITEDRMLNYCKQTKEYYYIIFHREELTESELYNFDEALAALINNLWQDLTEEERKQIKNILELEVRE